MSRKMFSYKKKRSDRERTIQTQTAQSIFSPKPFGIEETNEVSQSSPIDLQAQLESARKGFKFADMAITPPKNAFPAIQTKLTVGNANDKYEQEADQVVPQVVESINSLHDHGNQTIQRQEESVAKQVKNRGFKYPRQIASREDNQMGNYVRNPNPLLQRMFMPKREKINVGPWTVKPSLIQRQGMEQEEEVQMKPQETIQREETKEEKEVQLKPLVQRLASQRGFHSGSMPLFTKNVVLQRQLRSHLMQEAKLRTQTGKAIVQGDRTKQEGWVQRDAQVSAFEAGVREVNLTPKGSGRPLPDKVVDNFVQSGYSEAKDARVHMDDEATQSIQAKAYTQNNNIVVQSSRANDPKLLGHEATHVVQQSQMALKPDVNGTPINANPVLEKNADDNGERVARNEPVNVKGAKSPTGISRLQNSQQPIQRAGIISVKGDKTKEGKIKYDEKGRDKELYNFAKKKGTKPPFKRITVETENKRTSLKLERKLKYALKQKRKEEAIKRNKGKDENAWKKDRKYQQALKEWKAVKAEHEEFKELREEGFIEDKMVIERGMYGTKEEQKAEVGKNDNIDYFGHGNKTGIDGLTGDRVAREAAGAFELPKDWSGSIQIFACKFGVKGLPELAKNLAKSKQITGDKVEPAPISNFQEVGAAAFNMLRNAQTGVSHPQTALLKVFQVYNYNFIPDALKMGGFSKWMKGKGNIPSKYKELYEALTTKNKLGKHLEGLLDFAVENYIPDPESGNRDTVKSGVIKVLNNPEVSEAVAKLPTLEKMDSMEIAERAKAYAIIKSKLTQIGKLLIGKAHLIAESWRVLKKNEDKTKAVSPFGSAHKTQQEASPKVEKIKDLGKDRKQELTADYNAVKKAIKEAKKVAPVEPLETASESMQVATSASPETPVTLTEVTFPLQWALDYIAYMTPESVKAWLDAAST